ncbi:integral membrane protein [Xylariaceae sp. FL0804]|nr:integral membrane protein [Xylariaceae sp. FL0804]
MISKMGCATELPTASLPNLEVSKMGSPPVLPTPSVHKSDVSEMGFPTESPTPSIHKLEHVPASLSSVVITSAASVTFLSSWVSGIIVAALPYIARDTGLPSSLQLWPAALNALVCGCTLLAFGSVADIMGSRPIYLAGWALSFATTLGAGLAPDGPTLLAFRSINGIAQSMCMPTSISIVTKTLPQGPMRNSAFAAMGAGQPAGFTLGLVLGGVLASTIGWRWGFYIAAVMNGLTLILAIWKLPDTRKVQEEPIQWSKLVTDIDWVGVLIPTTALILLSIVLITVTTNPASIASAFSITLLVLSMGIIALFPLWENFQARRNAPILIPNRFWRNLAFSSICIMVAFTNGSFNAFETLMTLFWQEVQNQTPLQSSMRFLPEPLIGVCINVLTGYLVSRVSASWLVTPPTLISAATPVLMALSGPFWSYWRASFYAIALNAVGADALFTVSSLVITRVFDDDNQALAGSVFQTVSQLGKGVGLAIAPVIASAVTSAGVAPGAEPGPSDLFAGYQACFWLCFAMIMVVFLVGAGGLRGVGIVGAKKKL